MLETRTRAKAPAAAIPAWRFWVPVGLQVLMLLAVPLPKLAAYAVGTTVVLRTAPVDPGDPFRGRYATLGYEIATREALTRLPGWRDGISGDVYFTLAPDQPAWRAVAVSDRYPTLVPPGDVVLKGRRDGTQVTFGLEQYYVPDSQGDRLENALRAHRSGNLAEIKVDGGGTAVLTGLVVDTTRF
jgi:uncharacterized membrane-anchored protein